MENYSRFEIQKTIELENDLRIYGYDCIGLLAKEYGENYNEIIELEWNMCLSDFVAEYWDNNYLGFNI